MDKGKIADTNKEELIYKVGNFLGVLLLIMTHVFLYYRNIDSLRLVGSRLIYLFSPLSVAAMIAFIIQYSILFRNFPLMIKILKQNDHEEKTNLYISVCKNIGLFLVFNFISELIIIRAG